MITRSVAMFCWLACPGLLVGAPESRVDPLTRHMHITYRVPADAPEETIVQCSWSRPGTGDWLPAAVASLVSETALELVPNSDWREWTQGRIIERRAAGLDRTVVFNPYPQCGGADRIDVEFRIELSNREGKRLRTETSRIQVDNTDVVYIEDWTRVLQAVGNAATQPAAGNSPVGEQVIQPGWTFRRSIDAKKHVSFGSALYGRSSADQPLAPLTYPLNLTGWYAIYMVTEAGAGSPGIGSIRMRLSGDETADTLRSSRIGEEVLWKWARMDRQNLVIGQPHLHTGWQPAHIDYVKLVPLAPQQVDELEQAFGKPDKLVAGYWEPYSWAFYENVTTPAQHREPLAAFAWARIGLIDTQIGRVGMKVVYESRITDPLLYGTFGDPIAGCERPVTANVGRMQQYTNTLETELRYARELGLNLHANIGAGACYSKTPLQGDISKRHPDWLRGNTLRYELPEVRQYAIGLFREALQIGARAISIDFCRYPEGVDTVDTGNALMRELREMTKAFEGPGTSRVPILVRFPGTGVRLHERFDYATWARAGWVDYLCPSNIQGRHLNIDMTPYVEAVRGTGCHLLPALDGLGWGLPMPGPFFWRVRQLYDAGLDGIYVYQADARVLGRPAERRWMRMLSSRDALNRWWQAEQAAQPRRSKGIYLSRAEHPGGVFHRYERVRVWTDGVPLGPMELWVDGKLINRCEQPPYLLGTEDSTSDQLLKPGKHELRVRAADGNGWLEQTFSIETAN